MIHEKVDFPACVTVDRVHLKCNILGRVSGLLVFQIQMVSNISLNVNFLWYSYFLFYDVVDKTKVKDTSRMTNYWNKLSKWVWFLYCTRRWWSHNTIPLYTLVDRSEHSYWHAAVDRHSPGSIPLYHQQPPVGAAHYNNDKTIQEIKPWFQYVGNELQHNKWAHWNKKKHSTQFTQGFTKVHL